MTRTPGEKTDDKDVSCEDAADPDEACLDTDGDAVCTLLHTLHDILNDHPFRGEKSHDR